MASEASASVSGGGGGSAYAAAVEAAEGGDVGAMRDVGCALLRRGRASDNAAGVAWLERCVAAAGAARGLDDGVLSGAYYGLAYAYDNGVAGVRRDTARASACLCRAAACGNAQASALVGERRRLARKRRVLDFLLYGCLVVVFFACWTLRDLLDVVQFKEAYAVEVSGADARVVADASWRHGAFDGAARARLLARGARLLDATAPPLEPAAENASNPLGDGFRGTRGVVVHFTRAALQNAHAFGHDAYAWLRDGYVAHLLDDRCNAFVFNILVVPPGRAKKRSGADDATDGVGSHVDQTLIQSTTIREQTAFKVLRRGGNLPLDATIRASGRPRSGGRAPGVASPRRGRARPTERSHPTPRRPPPRSPSAT